MRRNKKVGASMPAIYFDMDGVLAGWRNVSVEETYAPGFYLSAPVNWELIYVINMLLQMGYDVRILSAAYNRRARAEKKKWLKAVGLGSLPRVFVPYGEPKARYVSGKAILVDDYSRNLREWTSIVNHCGIKYYNGINGTKGTWRGLSIGAGQGVGYMFAVIATAAYNLARYTPTRDGYIVSPDEYQERRMRRLGKG